MALENITSTLCGSAAESKFPKLEASKFLSELISNSLGEGDSAVSFSLDPQGVSVERGSGRELQSVGTIGPSWFTYFCQWVVERFSVFTLDLNVILPSKDLYLSPGFSVECCAKFNGRIFTFRSEKAERLNKTSRLLLSGFNEIPESLFFKFMAFSKASKESFDKILNERNGLILVSSPAADEAQLRMTTASYLSLTGGTLVDKPSKTDGLQLLALRSDDVIDACLKGLHEYGEVNDSRIVGVIHHGFIKRLCQKCARSAPVDPAFLDILPVKLKAILSKGYKIGRGCDACGQAGNSGRIGVQSVLHVDDALWQRLSSEPDYSALVDITYASGVRPLLEDGLNKIIDGLTTPESLFGLSRLIPASYMKFYRTEISTNPWPLDIDLFNSGNVQTGKALTGVEAFTLDLNKPIIEHQPKRAKPLLLIIEDDPDQREILALVLKSANYDVNLATDGLDAIEKIKKDGKPDLVITDLMMPRMDGKEFVENLRSMSECKQVPILVLTVVSDVEREYQLLTIGADDYCEKTVQRKILLRRVENLLKRANSSP